MTHSTDKRWDQLAGVLVDHSVETGKDDRVLVIMREPETFPLARAVYARLTERGAFPQVLFQSVYLEKELMKHGTHEQVAWVPELFETGMKWADVCIDIRGAANLSEFAGIATDIVSLHRKAEGKISALRTTGTRWVLIRVPNEAFAQSAGQSLDDVMEFFFNATIKDWASESGRLGAICEKLTGTRRVRITGTETDLTFSTEGRIYAADDGHINMPAGEIYTSPIEESAEGHITFENPGVFAGTLIHGIRLRFKAGVVVDASAQSNEEFLIQLLDMDEGSRRIGEFGIGTNQDVTFFSNDILYDEKMFGSVHIALGRSYPQCGGLNDSALHWDIIKDLRQSGTVYVDEREILAGGKLLL